MMNLLRKIKKVENLYNLLVLLDWLVGTTAVLFIGMLLENPCLRNWLATLTGVVISLILSFITVRVYVKMLKSIMQEAHK